MRAAAENQDRALLLGVPVRRLQTIVWAVAGALSTASFITKAPFSGVVPAPRIVGAAAILPGLAVAVIARFQSLPDRARRRASASASPSGRSAGTSTAESIFDVTFLVVILVALLAAARSTLTRAETGESSWDSAGVLKPIPRELRNVAEVQWARRGHRRRGRR